MPHAIVARPAPDEYAPYFQRYIGRVPAGDLVQVLDDQLLQLPALLTTVGESRSAHRYASGKWSVREVVGHLIDTERVFSYRATQFSRGDRRPLPSFEQDAWVPFGEYHERTLASLGDEWCAVRGATLALVRGLPAPALARRGIASDMEFSVLALLCVIAGHLQHHVERLPLDYAAAFDVQP